MTDKRELQTSNQDTTARDLQVLSETGLITEGQFLQLAKTTKALTLMHNIVAEPDRHLAAQYRQLTALGKTSPVSEALDALHQLKAIWDPARRDFQKYRRLYAEGKLAAKKIAKQRRELAETMNHEDREILAAEIELAEADLEALETELSIGKDHMKAIMDQAVEHSQQYQIACTAAGTDTITQDDIDREQIDYYLKTAWFHAANTAKNYVLIDPRNKQPDGSDIILDKKVKVAAEVELYFEVMGVSKKEIAAGLEDLMSTRESFDQMSFGQMRDFRPYFEGWLDRVTKKHLQTVTAAFKADKRRMQRMQSMIDPNQARTGQSFTGDYDEVDHSSML